MIYIICCAPRNSIHDVDIITVSTKISNSFGLQCLKCVKICELLALFIKVIALIVERSVNSVCVTPPGMGAGGEEPWPAGRPAPSAGSME